MMRALIWLTAAAAVLYGGYWVVGSRAVLSGAETALAAMKAEGRADYSDVSLVGFPSRFDLTVSDPVLRSPDGGTVWQAPFVQVFALSYRPHRLIAVWPHDQTLTLGSVSYAIGSEDLRASVALIPDLDLPLDHATIEGHGVSVTAPPGWTVRADKLILASRQAGDAARHQLALVLTGLAPGPELKGLLDPAARLPAAVQEAEADAVAVFDRPIDRGLTDAPARLTALEAIDLRFAWGPVSVQATGAVRFDLAGVAEGRLDVAARNWRDLYGLMVEAGAVPPERALAIQNVLAEIAKASGEPELLNLPLRFSGGQTWIGVIPVGPAPRL
jgi:hypothetical protein